MIRINPVFEWITALFGLELSQVLLLFLGSFQLLYKRSMGILWTKLMNKNILESSYLQTCHGHLTSCHQLQDYENLLGSFLEVLYLYWTTYTLLHLIRPHLEYACSVWDPIHLPLRNWTYGDTGFYSGKTSYLDMNNCFRHSSPVTADNDKPCCYVWFVCHDKWTALKCRTLGAS